MPNIKSAKKRVLVTEKKNAKNAAQKSALRTSIKKAKVAIAENNENAFFVAQTVLRAVRFHRLQLSQCTNP